MAISDSLISDGKVYAVGPSPDGKTQRLYFKFDGQNTIITQSDGTVIATHKVHFTETECFAYFLGMCAANSETQ